LIWEERNRRVFENSCSPVEPIFRRFQVLFYMILCFHQRDLPIPNWLVADRYGDAIIWFALRWAASASLWCYCSYWVLVLLFWYAWLHWPFTAWLVAFPCLFMEGIMTYCYFLWLVFALCRCMVGCLSTSLPDVFNDGRLHLLSCMEWSAVLWLATSP
jgi:hypothetical protein